MKKTLSILALLILITGCANPVRRATPIEGLFVQEDFKGPQLAQGGMVVGGVVVKPGKFDLKLSEEVSPLLMTAFQRERRYLKPQPPSTLREAIGDKRYLAVMKGFATKDLTEDMLTSIAAVLPNIRYLALARIDEDADGGIVTVRRDTEEKTLVVGNRIYTLILYHVHTMAVAMTIYDLKSRSIAFSGRLKDDVAYRLDFEGGEEPVTLVGYFSDYGPPKTYDPPMPSTNEILPYFFIAFSTNLPVLWCSEVPGSMEGCIDEG